MLSGAFATHMQEEESNIHKKHVLIFTEWLHFSASAEITDKREHSIACCLCGRDVLGSVSDAAHPDWYFPWFRQPHPANVGTIPWDFPFCFCCYMYSIIENSKNWNQQVRLWLTLICWRHGSPRHFFCVKMSHSGGTKDELTIEGMSTKFWRRPWW